jgi:hypothetical protein
MKTITICGSLRFYEAMIGYAMNRPDTYFLPQPESIRELAIRHHRERVERSDSILVFNYGGYIGADTLAEIQFAEKLGKGVEYLETEKCGTCGGTGQCDFEPCPSCNHHSRFDCFEWSAIGRNWRKDSSLEKWFPFTAKELSELRQRLKAAEKWMRHLDGCALGSRIAYNSMTKSFCTCGLDDFRKEK